MGREGRTPPPPPPVGSNSFNFMQFLGKFGKIMCWPLPPESWRPHLGEILDPLLTIHAGWSSSTCTGTNRKLALIVITDIKSC